MQAHTLAHTVPPADTQTSAHMAQRMKQGSDVLVARLCTRRVCQPGPHQGDCHSACHTAGQV